MITVYLGLGSNLAQPQGQIVRALQALAANSEVKLLASSSLYGSTPMGPQDQPDYVNAVVCLETALAADALLQLTQQIEQQQGRERKAERWGPRTLDIDILLYGQQQINTDSLVIPHYGLRQREFVLYPLQEINPTLSLPDGDSLAELIAHCPRNGLHIISPPPVW